jgi:hypothetical protein
MNNLLIVGNGFDLAHGLKTSYKDFVIYVTNSIIQDEDVFPKLFSNKFIDGSYSYSRIIEEHSNGLDIFNQLGIKNYFFKIILIEQGLNDWSDIETLYFSALNDEYSDESTRVYRFKDKLNKDFEEIKQCLEKYLSLNHIDSKKKIDRV